MVVEDHFILHQEHVLLVGVVGVQDQEISLCDLPHNDLALIWLMQIDERGELPDLEEAVSELLVTCTLGP